MGLIAILMLPCALGLLVYYEFSDDRLSEEVDGDTIYYNDDGGLKPNEDLRDTFLTFSEFLNGIYCIITRYNV